MSNYGGMFCPPVCPKCFVGLHYEHAKPGAPPCPRCGHEHPEGLSLENYERAKAEWNEPKCSRCGLAVDERAKYFADPLCAACCRLAGRVVDLNPTGPKWQVVTSRRNRGALDDRTEYLCIRVRKGPEEAWEMAVCGFQPDPDECDFEDEAGLCDRLKGNDGDHVADIDAPQPLIEYASIEITHGGLEGIVAGLQYLEWPECDLEVVAQAIVDLD